LGAAAANALSPLSLSLVLGTVSLGILGIEMGSKAEADQINMVEQGCSGI